MLKKIFTKLNRPKVVGVRPESREADYPQPEIKEVGPYIGEWAVLSYYLPDDLMHSEDAKEYLGCAAQGESLYSCTRESDEWVTLTNNIGLSYRVNPKRVLWVVEPDYALGQQIETTNGTLREGKIKSRGWHLKKSALLITSKY